MSEVAIRRLRAAALLLVAAYGIGQLISLHQPAWVFPNWFWPRKAPWWWPFHEPEFAYGVPAIAAGIGGGACLLYAAARCEVLGRRGLVGLILLGTLLVQAGLLLLPGHGLAAYAWRLSHSAHREFFLRAAFSPGVGETLLHYEEQLRNGSPAQFSRQKGPANLATHVALHRLAQAPGIREFLDRRIDRAPGLLAAVSERLGKEWKRPALDPVRGRAVVRSFLLMPLFAVALRALCAVAAFFLGAAFFDRRGATLVAIATALLPGTSLEFVHLDGSVFPLLSVTTLALFFQGEKASSARFAGAAGVATALHLYFTLAAVTSVGLCTLAGGLRAAVASLRRWRCSRGTSERPAPRVREALRAGAEALRNLGGYWLGLLASLAFLRIGLSFRVALRYADARSIQSRWRGAGEGWRWAALNVFEFFMTLGPVLSACAAVGIAVALWSLFTREPRRIGVYAAALLLNFAVLVAIGANSEVYRLWAFLGAAFALPAVYGASVLWTRPTRGAVVFTAASLLWLALLAPRFGWLL